MNNTKTAEATTTGNRPTGRRRPVVTWIAGGVATALTLVLLVTVRPGGGQIEVTGDEYSFTGVPDHLTAGQHRFQLKNEGNEPHEIVIIHLKEKATFLDEVLTLPEEEAMTKVEVVGRAQTEPGKKSAKLTVNLESGRYALMCFVPTGGSGRPHFAHGMTAQFTVR